MTTTKHNTKGLLTEIYCYDETTGYRSKVEEIHCNVKQAESSIFLHKLRTTVVGYQIKNNRLPDEHTVIQEWWDRKARRVWVNSTEERPGSAPGYTTILNRTQI